MSFHEKVAQVSLDCFQSLPKTGKPNVAEWTILSTIVKEQNGVYEVVALGTGSKCIGSAKMSADGDVLNDSHAEVICRRAFLAYLYDEMLKSNSTLLTISNGKFALDAGVKFHFFTTHTPCGDASIFPKHARDDVGKSKSVQCDSSGEVCAQSYSNENRIPGPNKLNSTVSIGMKNKESECGEVLNKDERDAKRLCREGDIFRTGAKCLPGDANKDPHEGGADYHVIGAIRTKPGRGDRTLSVSCSDKLAKWCFLGIQGCLLSSLLKEPIYLESLTIVGNTPFSEEALDRALFKRFPCVDLREPYKRHELQIGRVESVFPFGKDDSKRPCPSSVIYVKSNERKIEVAVEGRRQGVAKKDVGKKSSLLSVCKLSLFGKFLRVVRRYGLMKDVELKRTYGGFKAMNRVYKDNWNSIKSESFNVWTVKDARLLEFYEN